MARMRKAARRSRPGPSETELLTEIRDLLASARLADRRAMPYGGAGTASEARGRRAGSTMSDAIIQLEHVSKRFGQKLAVDDVTVDVPRGRCFAWLGPNGCGKTTLIRMMLGLAQPTGGRIHLRGYEVPSDIRSALSRVGGHRRGAALLPVPQRPPQPRRLGRALRRRGPRAHPRGARARGAERARRRQGQDLLARHAPAPRRRARAAQRPRAAGARRADERARPRRHARVPHDDPRARRARRSARSSSRRTSSTRCRRWPTTSRSCRPAG